MSWSSPGYENASYCISHTGRQPAMQRPIAVPRIPASASGVSTQRSAPNLSRSPAVARKTPPARPDVLAHDHHVRVAVELDVEAVVDRLEDRLLSHWSLRESGAARPGRAPGRAAGCRTRSRTRARCRRAARPRPRRCPARITSSASCADRLGLLVREDALPAEVALVAAEALVAAFLLDALQVDVGLRIVRGRVGSGAVGERLDERRPLARRGRARPPRASPRSRRARRRRPPARPASRSRPPCP